MARHCAGVVLLLAFAAQVNRVEVFTEQVEEEVDGATYNKTPGKQQQNQQQLFTGKETAWGTAAATQGLDLDLDEVTGSDTVWINATPTSGPPDWTSDHNTTVTSSACRLPNGTVVADPYLCMQLLLQSSIEPVFNQRGTATEGQITPSHQSRISSPISPEDSTSTNNSTRYQYNATQWNPTIGNNSTSLLDYFVNYLGNRTLHGNTSGQYEWNSAGVTDSHTAAESRTVKAAVAATITAEADPSEGTAGDPLPAGDTVSSPVSSTLTRSAYNETTRAVTAESAPSSLVTSPWPGHEGESTLSPSQPRSSSSQTLGPAASSTPTTHLPPGGGWLQTDLPERKGYPAHAIHGLIWEDRRYLLSVLVPVGCGVAGALTIVCLAYAFRNCRQEHMLPLHKQPPQAEVNPGLDRILLLADSSDDEM